MLDFDGISVEYHAGRPSRSDGLPPGVLPPISLFTFLGVVGIVIGILFGIIVSRWLVAPLSRLAAMVRQAGSRNFKLRITPEGSEEIQDVARAFNEMATQLETSEKLRNNLIADVAHELRTPLTVMQSNLRALLDDIYPLSKAEILTLYDQTRHLTQLVNDLHELSLADAHELPISQQNINLNHFLKTIADIFKPITEAENIEFVMEITQTPLRVSGDEVRLKQVIQNMLVNAHRHTPSGGKITLQLYAKENQAAIRVIDTGEGISEEHIEHIFERFYRADLSRQRANGGTGLGLAIGKAIIEAHGGEISVTSRVNSSSGTCFEILLPVRI
ncbi:MAG: ATP-binding protein [Chloroflexota bacterium]